MKNAEDFLKEHGKELNVEHYPNTKRNVKKQNKSTDNNIEQFDEFKTKVLKYVLYKKRTEQEIRQKFSSTIDENLLAYIIQNLKENAYINDENYIQKAVKEFISLKTLSIKEIRNKLCIKGLSNSIIDNYFSKNQQELNDYEIDCAKKIILKKQSQMEKQEIENFLYKKGYSSDNIKIAFNELEILT